MELSAPSVSEGSVYEVRIQSTQLSGAIPLPKGCDIVPFLTKDTSNRVCTAGDNLIFTIFPDEAFGFTINEHFAQNFHNVFLSGGGTLDAKNFPNESATATFLNKIITTVTCFLHTSAIGQKHIKPLRYFSALHSSVPVPGAVDRKPDIALIRLIDESYTREGRLEWKDVQALVEHTISKEAPSRMPKTITDKNYMIFCDQPERNFILNLCITGSGYHVVVSDHAGQIDTDLMSFNQTSTVLLFLRMVMGLAFLPDKWLGIDDTIIRRVHGQKPSSTKFDIAYPTFKSTFNDPKITLIHPVKLDLGRPFAITTEAAREGECPDFDTISIGDKSYKVIDTIFQSPTFIGRATKVFLVSIGENRQGVLKDSFITIDRRTEESILNGLAIPFGPEVVDHCILEDTSRFRASLIRPAAFLETRQKRRILTYPAGVHISDFSSLWELMVAFLDVTVGMSFCVSAYSYLHSYSYVLS
jgi:hypothetical protein